MFKPPDMSDQTNEPTVAPEETAIRRDPCEILPLEIFISIMQHGLVEDHSFVMQYGPIHNRYFVLKSSWVSKLWRETLNKSCPELWSTFEARGHELISRNRKTQIEKRQAWIERSHGRFTTVSLRSLTLTSVSLLPKLLHKHFKPVTDLFVSGEADEVLRRFVEIHKPYENFSALKRVVIRGGSGRQRRAHRGEMPEGERLTCGFVGSATTTLESLKISSVKYRRVRWHTPRAPYIDRFPSLKVLDFVNCYMDYSYTPRQLSGGEMDYQQDPLHNLLRGANQLKSLKISLSTGRPTDTPDPVPRPGLFNKVEMPHLVSAELPPPAVWSFDILAPVLDTLIFKWESYGHCGRHDTPWIPEIQDAPVPFERLGNLKIVQLACTHHDDISRLRAWLPQLDGVTSLTLHNAGYNRWYPEFEQPDVNDVADGEREGGAAQPGDVRVSIRLSQLLADSPELCPSMTELTLESCFTNGKSLVDFVRKRKILKDCAEIQRLNMINCTHLSQKAYNALKTEVPVVRWSNGGSKCHCKSHQNDDFEFDVPIDEMRPLPISCQGRSGESAT